ncbi:MAG: hypothetical protein AAGJ35_12080, partial [Myxococcota bacterium]
MATQTHSTNKKSKNSGVHSKKKAKSKNSNAQYDERERNPPTEDAPTPIAEESSSLTRQTSTPKKQEHHIPTSTSPFSE